MKRRILPKITHGRVKKMNRRTIMERPPLCIEIDDGRNITISEDGKTLGAIQELKLHAAVDKIPPVLEVTIPEISEGMSDGMKESIATTIEVIQAHGGQIFFKPPSEFAIDRNPEEQLKAERSLSEQLPVIDHD